MRVFVGVLACAGVAVSLAGCGGGGDGGGGTGTDRRPTSVAVSSSAPGPLTAVGQTRTLTAVVKDQKDAEMTNASVTWSSSDINVATVSPTRGLTTTLTAVGNGNATITAKVTTAVKADVAFGVTAVQGPTVDVTTPGTTFSPATVTIAPGSTVRWTMTGSETPHNVHFESLKPPGGDSPSVLNQGEIFRRTFPNAGTYDYFCSIHAGMQGTVIVQ